MALAYLFGRGPATGIPFGLHAFIESRPGLDAPDLELLLRGAPPSADLWFPGLRPRYEDGFGVGVALMHPKSRGEVRLASADPAAAPVIEHRYLEDPSDRDALRAAIGLVRDFVAQPALDPFRGDERKPGRDVVTNEQLDAYVRATCGSVAHPIGTCKMGTAPDCVLDPDLRVRGVGNLRVIDASAMPDLVSAHTNACVLMMAEKAADFIRGNHP
jgi:choline dehydrogenase-like flavoprotein